MIYENGTPVKLLTEAGYVTLDDLSLIHIYISSMVWKSGEDDIMRGYRFTYDNLNRLTNAVYGDCLLYTSHANYQLNRGALQRHAGGLYTLTGSFGLDAPASRVQRNRLSRCV